MTGQRHVGALEFSRVTWIVSRVSTAATPPRLAPVSAEDQLEQVAEIEVDPQRATVYEEGWQSWSPTRAYRFGPFPARPRHAKEIAMHFRADRLAPAHA